MRGLFHFGGKGGCPWDRRLIQEKKGEGEEELPGGGGGRILRIIVG